MIFTNREALALNILLLRKRRAWSQEQAAGQAGISKVALLKIENRDTDPSLKTLRLLADCFSVQVEDLLRSVEIPDDVLRGVAEEGGVSRYRNDLLTDAAVISELYRIISRFWSCGDYPCFKPLTVNREEPDWGLQLRELLGYGPSLPLIDITGALWSRGILVVPFRFRGTSEYIVMQLGDSCAVLFVDRGDSIEDRLWNTVGGLISLSRSSSSGLPVESTLSPIDLLAPKVAVSAFIERMKWSSPSTKALYLKRHFRIGLGRASSLLDFSPQDQTRLIAELAHMRPGPKSSITEVLPLSDYDLNDEGVWTLFYGHKAKFPLDPDLEFMYNVLKLTRD